MSKIPIFDDNDQIIDYATFDDEFEHIFKNHHWILDEEGYPATHISIESGGSRLMRMDYLVLVLADHRKSGIDISTIDYMKFIDFNNLGFFQVMEFDDPFCSDDDVEKSLN